MHTFIELVSNDDTKTECNLANLVFKTFNSEVSYGYLNLNCFVEFQMCFVAMYIVLFLCLHKGILSNKLFTYRSLCIYFVFFIPILFLILYCI